MEEELNGHNAALRQNLLFFSEKKVKDSQEKRSDKYKEFAIQLNKLGLDQGDLDKIINIVNSQNEGQHFKE